VDGFGYGLLKALHILFIVTWLGVDAGVFLGSHLIRNRAYDPGARFLVSRLMGYLDLGPRLSVPLTFAVGLNLAYLGGWGATPGWVVWVCWVAALAWCGAIVYAFVLQHGVESGHPLTAPQQGWLRGYRRVDLWARWLWIAVIAGALIGALVGQAVFHGTWLNLKLALFGLVILVGNGLRLMPGTSSMALMAQIYREGSTPEREDALYGRLSLTHPIILTMYGSVIVSLFLGVLKP
jgi:hypothetical protein